jgi:thioredoxin-dependent peroxiredoxin
MRKHPWLAGLVRGLAIALLLLSSVLPGTAAEALLGGPLPPEGQPAPTFTLPTNTGDGTLSLADYRGQWVVLYFYPKDFTSGCTLEAQRFQKDLPDYIKRHAQVLGVSVDSVDSHAEFCESEGLKFPLLADTDASVSKAYGAWLSPYSLRHTYIVDPEGVLRATYTAVRPAVHSTEVLEKLDQLQAAG